MEFSVLWFWRLCIWSPNTQSMFCRYILTTEGGWNCWWNNCEHYVPIRWWDPSTGTALLYKHAYELACLSIVSVPLLMPSSFLKLQILLQNFCHPGIGCLAQCYWGPSLLDQRKSEDVSILWNEDLWIVSVGRLWQSMTGSLTSSMYELCPSYT